MSYYTHKAKSKATNINAMYIATGDLCTPLKVLDLT